jgi:DNA-binding transcriptional MerR regulator
MTGNDDAELLPIGDLAKELGVSHRALRFYEDRKILSSTIISGVRHYDSWQRRRAAEIVRLRSLGFTVTQIGELLRNPESSEGRERLRLAVERQMSVLERQRQEIDRALEELRKLLP